MLREKMPVQSANNFRSAFADSDGAIAHQSQYSSLSNSTPSSGHQRLSSALPAQRPISGHVKSLREATANLSNRSGSSRSQAQGWLGQQVEGIRKRLSQANSHVADSPNKGPLVGIIDTGFGQGQHGQEVLKAIQSGNTASQILVADGVGKGTWAESLTQFVDVAKASGQKRAVANLSFDLSQKNPDGSVTTRHQLTAAESKALDYAKQNNVLVVASAGNEGDEMSALGAASKRSDNLIVVGTAQGNNRAAYSSFGPGLDFLVAADSQQKAGTSMAAAETTRAIAQLWSDHPQLTPNQVVQALEVTAKDLKTPGWDMQTGMGLLNPNNAAIAADALSARPALARLGLLKTSQNSGSNREMWTGGEGVIASERPNRLTGDLSSPPSTGMSAARARNEHQAHRRSTPSRGISAARASNEHQAHRPSGASSGSSRASLAESRQANIDAANARARDRNTNAQRDAAMARRAHSEQQANAQQSASQTLKYVPGTTTMRSDRVKQWQSAMKAQGFDIAVDGAYGPQSVAVAREFQQRNGLIADGLVGPQTWAASFRQPANPRQADAQAGWTNVSNTAAPQANAQATLKYTPGTAAMSSDRVKQWQNAMKAQGFDIAVDGLYGPQSAAVAREFQRRNGLEPDGRVGPQTWAASFPYRGMSADTAERYALRDRANNQLITAASAQETIKYVPGTSTMSSDRIRQWQTAMKNKGFDIAADGKFGPQSAAVAREFQQQKGLVADGRVGPQTWAASFVPPVRSTPRPPTPTPRQADAQEGVTEATFGTRPPTSPVSLVSSSARGPLSSLAGTLSNATPPSLRRTQTAASSPRQAANPRQADAQVGSSSAAMYPATRRRAGNRARTPRTYITYTLRDARGDVRYVGRTSGIGTPENVMANRLNHPKFGKHHILKRYPNLNLTARVEGVQSNSSSNKGAEEVLYTRLQRYVPNRTLRAPGTGVQISGGINQGGRQLLNRLTPTSNKTGGPLVTAYVNDSGAWNRTAYESQSRQLNASASGASGASGRAARGAVRGVSRVAAPVGIALDGYSLYDAYRQDGGFGENFGSTAGSVAGGWGGAAGGAAVGAAIGSVVPGVGTVVGGIVGGIIGGFGGSLLGEEVVEQVQGEP